MAEATQNVQLPSPPAATRASWIVRGWGCYGPILLFSLLCLGLGSIRAGDSYSTVIQNQLALETPTSDHTSLDPTAQVPEPQIADLKRAVRAEIEILPRAPQLEPPPPPSRKEMILALVMPLAGVMALVGIGYLVKRQLDALLAASELTESRTAALLAEDPSVGRFFSELRDVLTEPEANEAANAEPSQTADAKSEAAPDPLQEFYAAVPGVLAGLRKRLLEVNGAADELARKPVLLAFLGEVDGLKQSARPPELRPVWLLACALEGLLKQLANNASEFTASVVSTMAGAVDLLDKLVVRGVNPQLATEPPIKLLAVDDDPISRLAISFALKKAFNPPDLAPEAETALGWCAREPYYDVIFLDVDMPGMDGYELCTRIHQLEAHRTAPVVFVTRHSDFQSRAVAALKGGESLISKPFPAFEITVKALTLAMRGRLQPRADASRSAADALVQRLAAGESNVPAVVASKGQKSPAEERNGRQCHSNFAGSTRAGDLDPSALVETPGEDSPEDFFARGRARVNQLHQLMQAAQQAADLPVLNELLGQLYVGVHSFNLEAERAELRAIAKVSSALESLLKKLVGKATRCTPSILDSAASALELLGELCIHAQPSLDLSHPPVSILVVDDDPVARRGISAAVQIAFHSPDCAECGESALALAKRTAYDLIFLDVMMPGMDGLTACSRIHETSQNRRTPVVFVTAHDDQEGRTQAMDAGGCGFIPKPVMSTQLRLVAITFILRARLYKSLPVPAAAAEACLELA